MPCDSIETSKVDFKNADAKFVARALESLGYRVDIEKNAVVGHKGWAEVVDFSKVTGQLKITTATKVNVSQITRAYSTEVVKFAAEEYGWNFEQTGESEFSIEKATL